MLTGETLRAQRLALGFSQSQLGELLAVDSNTIARWERGELNIRHPSWLEARLKEIERERYVEKRE